MRGIETRMLLACPERYRDRKDERTGPALFDKGRIIPEISRVMFGCVRIEGAVDTDATGIGGREEFVQGSETMNGMEGVVVLTLGGTGLITVARA